MNNVTRNVFCAVSALVFSGTIFCADPVVQKPQLPENYRETLVEIINRHINTGFFSRTAQEIRLLGERNKQWKACLADRSCMESIITVVSPYYRNGNNPVFIAAELSTPASLAWCKEYVQRDADDLHDLWCAMHLSVEETAYVAEGVIKLDVLPPSYGTLQTAARLGRCDLIHYLLDKGTPVDIIPTFKFEYKETALIKATLYNQTGAAALLIEKGADLNRMDGGCPQQAPLHFAAINGNWSLVQKLVYAGAQVNLRDGTGRTPLRNVLGSEAGTQQERNSVIDLLLKHGAKN